MACGATLTFKRTLEFDSFHGQPSKRRCLPASRLASTVNQTPQKSSPFSNAAPKVTTEQIAARISSEIKRLQHHRRRTHGSNSSSPPPTGSPPLSHRKEFASVSSLLTAANLHTAGCSPPLHCRDTPVLSLRQVGLVCERMMKEREDQIREEYDKVLGDKLNEQYEAFLKFNHDQLHRKFGETAASYVS